MHTGNKTVDKWGDMDPDDIRPKPKPGIVIGEDLSMLSVEELEGRITTLKDEIIRIEEAVASKRASREQASSVFKF